MDLKKRQVCAFHGDHCKTGDTLPFADAIAFTDKDFGHSILLL
jgi:hypothetical protein